MWDTDTAGLQRRFMELNAYIRKEEKSQSNNLSSYFKNLNSKKAGEKIRTKINETESEKHLFSNKENQ